VDVHLSLSLPRDRLSVPFARHVCASAMRELGVDETCRSAIEIALSEACSNVVNHSQPEDEYEVELILDLERAIIRVADTGRGFDHESLVQGAVDDESGRGLMLMRALVDNVQFDSRPEDGFVVHLEKAIEIDDDAIARLLSKY
jgi:serine/threonine-protein kinase RsbW